MTSSLRKRNLQKKCKRKRKIPLSKKHWKRLHRSRSFQAVSYTVKDVIIDNWLESQKAYEKQDPKIVYYMSMEFLMGRALGNNLINLGAYGEVKEALEELGLDINCTRRPGAGSGTWKRWSRKTGSMLSGFPCNTRTTVHTDAESVTVMVCSSRRSETVIRLRHRITGLKNGYPFELRRPEYAKEVHFGGYVRVECDR